MIKPKIISDEELHKLTDHWNPSPSRLDGLTQKTIEQKLFRVVAQKALDDCYKEMLEQFKSVVDKLTVIRDWDIRNKYLEGYNQTVHLVLADPLGTEHRKREINGRKAVAKAQLQYNKQTLLDLMGEV